MEHQILLPYSYGDANVSTNCVVMSQSNQEAGLGCLGPACCRGVRSQQGAGCGLGGRGPLPHTSHPHTSLPHTSLPHASLPHLTPLLAKAPLHES